MTKLKIVDEIRRLTADELGIGVSATAHSGLASSTPDSPPADPTSPQVREILGLLQRYSGVLLSGAPGTSKSYLAHTTAAVLVNGDQSRLAITQFHPSYQYEDFMEGFRPVIGGGFELREGVFLELCGRADSDPTQPYAIVIDELSRGDAARIFGEALTYIEKSKRGLPFLLPSGRSAAVPPNLSIIATMNPLDRGVDEVDAAFERRFAKVSMPPNASLLESRLAENGVNDQLRSGIIDWFLDINGQGVPGAAVGHAYFWDATDEKSLRDVWQYQLRFHVEKAFRFDASASSRLTEKWGNIFDDIEHEKE